MQYEEQVEESDQRATTTHVDLVLPEILSKPPPEVVYTIFNVKLA
jgi:hypothetical protein